MKIISVWSTKGGVGKTTLTLHLSEALALAGKKVLLLDTDRQASALEVKSRSEDFNFDAVGEIPDSVDGYDYIVVDFPPKTAQEMTSAQRKILKRSDHILSPIRASSLDLMSFKKIKNDFEGDQRLLPVLSCYDARTSDQKAVKTKIATDYPVVSYLAVFASAINERVSVFSKKIKANRSVTKARNEIRSIMEIVK